MRTLLTGECKPENIFRLMDSTELLEVDFEAEVVKALTCLLPDYFCGVFAGVSGGVNPLLFGGEGAALDGRRVRAQV